MTVLLVDHLSNRVKPSGEWREMVRRDYGGTQRPRDVAKECLALSIAAIDHSTEALFPAEFGPTIRAECRPSALDHEDEEQEEEAGEDAWKASEGYKELLQSKDLNEVGEAVGELMAERCGCAGKREAIAAGAALYKDAWTKLQGYARTVLLVRSEMSAGAGG